jgi:hypothetical protein
MYSVPAPETKPLPYFFIKLSVAFLYSFSAVSFPNFLVSVVSILPLIPTLSNAEYKVAAVNVLTRHDALPI